MSRQFEYVESDQEGLEILDAISEADDFNQWMYEVVKPFCSGKILEVGSGLGNISRHFLLNGHNITLSDIRCNYREFLRHTFELSSQLVLDIDIAEIKFDQKYPELINSFDSVFCLNVVEHIENDRIAIRNLLRLLKTGGSLTVLVPAYPFLYNDIDKNLMHFRRYTKRSLAELFDNKKSIRKIFHFNAAGILAWFIGGKLFRFSTIPKGEMKLYNRFVPLWKFIDLVLSGWIGLSVVCVIRKSDSIEERET